MAQALTYPRVEQYSKNALFKIRDAGTQDWHVPPHYIAAHSIPRNVAKPTFNPGTISIFQQAIEPIYDARATLQNDVYMCKATWSVTDLYDIRVRERAFGTPEHPQTGIELHAVCKSPPNTKSLLIKVRTFRSLVADLGHIPLFSATFWGLSPLSGSKPGSHTIILRTYEGLSSPCSGPKLRPRQSTQANAVLAPRTCFINPSFDP